MEGPALSASPTRRWHRLEAPLVVALLTIGGCGSDDDPNGGSTTSSTTTVSTTTTLATEPSSSSPTTATSITTTTTTDPAPTGARIELEVAGGEVEGGVGQEQASLGDEVTIAVTSDVADEVHVHGYDLKVDVQPGVPGELTFTADIPGVFEVELEEAGLKLLDLEVS